VVPQDWVQGQRKITITPAAAVLVKLLCAPGGKSARDKRYHKQGLQLDKTCFPKVEGGGGSISRLANARFIPHWHINRTRLRTSVIVESEPPSSIYMDRTEFVVKVQLHVIVELALHYARRP
jgi:hypothetical protein